MFGSRFMPCDECGDSIDRHDEVVHDCDADRRLDYLMFELRSEVARLEPGLGAWLETPAGRFAVWCARQGRMGGA